MTIQKLEEILQKGEGIDIEFKTSQFELNKDAFESICALLNRKGGHLLLGVNNRGEVEGVFDDCVQNIINQIITCANNPQKLNPIVYLSPEIIDYKGKKVIHILIPESSQVHATNGKVFDRNEDGDFNITGHSAQVNKLYLRKQDIYTENRIYPYVRLTDFKPELFGRIRILAKNQRPNHPWSEMTDEELVRSAGLMRYDYNTDRHGYTLAAVLLLGKDEVIRDILSYHKTDAIVRIENVDRYDDRDEIRTNLIDSYDRLMEFVKKHLPDKFYQEGDMRISLRDHIFREVISNLLIHREYASAFPAKFIIEGNRVITENWNRPHDGGIINPANFSPYPKNPAIANFFKEIGWVDELGSGVRNTYKYCGKYTQGTSPQFVDEEIFKTIIPIKLGKFGENTEKVRRKYGESSEKVRRKFGESSEKILEFIEVNPYMSAIDMAENLGITERAVEKNLARLKADGILYRVGPDKGGYWKIKSDEDGQ